MTLKNSSREIEKPDTNQKPEQPLWETALAAKLSNNVTFDTSGKIWSGNANSWSDNLDDLSRTQSFWRNQAERLGAYPIEYLLPRIRVPYIDSLPGISKQADDSFRRNPTAFKELSEQSWGYYFYLGGGHSTRDKEGHVEVGRALSNLRFQMINDTVCHLLGDSKPEMTLVDFASNWGAFSIDMAYRGLKECVGFDIRKENVQKANSLAEYLNIGNASFIECDVYEAKEKLNKSFDIVYNLGLMYHITDPFNMMKVTYDMCDKMAVVDTLATRDPFSGFLNNHVPSSSQSNHAKGVREIELRPTYRAIIDLMRAVGFKDLMEITVDLNDSFPKSKARNVYENLHRRVVVGFK